MKFAAASHRIKLKEVCYPKPEHFVLNPHTVSLTRTSTYQQPPCSVGAANADKRAKSRQNKNLQSFSYGVNLGFAGRRRSIVWAIRRVLKDAVPINGGLKSDGTNTCEPNRWLHGLTYGIGLSNCSVTGAKKLCQISNI